MSSAAQVLANQSNARNSTGPVTEEGKSHSSQNSVKHGLTSKAIVLPHESLEEFNLFVADLNDAYRPASTHESSLVNIIAEATWRRQRMYRLEAAFFANRLRAAEESNSDLQGDEALVSLFVDAQEMKRSQLLIRYVHSAERACEKAIANLKQAQKDRRARDFQEAMAIEPEEESEPATNTPESLPPLPAGYKYIQYNGKPLAVRNDYQCPVAA